MAGAAVMLPNPPHENMRLGAKRLRKALHVVHHDALATEFDIDEGRTADAHALRERDLLRADTFSPTANSFAQ